MLTRNAEGEVGFGEAYDLGDQGVGGARGFDDGDGPAEAGVGGGGVVEDDACGLADGLDADGVVNVGLVGDGAGELCGFVAWDPAEVFELFGELLADGVVEEEGGAEVVEAGGAGVGVGDVLDGFIGRVGLLRGGRVRVGGALA